MPVRKFSIKGIAVKVEYKHEFDPKTFEKINQRFEGVVQLDIVSSGNFSCFDEESLKSLIISYFQQNPKMMIPDVLRSSN